MDSGGSTEEIVFQVVKDVDHELRKHHSGRSSQGPFHSHSHASVVERRCSEGELWSVAVLKVSCGASLC
jgi:hypothetical protein